jgi:redox-sensitive bicupin YhaK (pirin superfamily)
MSAGSGIIHEEMPVVGGARGESGRGESASAGIRGFQLWVNLPKAAKMSAPAYRDVAAGTIPEIIEGGARVRVIAGRYGGEGASGSAREDSAAAGAVEGAARNIAGDPTYLDVSLERGAAFAHPVADGDTALLYVIEGRALIGESRTPAAAGDLVVTGAGALVRVEAAEGANSASGTAARFLVMIGTPLREPIAWHGPIVMNTEEELREAFAELRDGSFIKGR